MFVLFNKSLSVICFLSTYSNIFPTLGSKSSRWPVVSIETKFWRIPLLLKIFLQSLQMLSNSMLISDRNRSVSPDFTTSGRDIKLPSITAAASLILPGLPLYDRPMFDMRLTKISVCLAESIDVRSNGTRITMESQSTKMYGISQCSASWKCNISVIISISQTSWGKNFNTVL